MADVVSVRAAARLHLGFLDPSATLGRRFGSLGLAIEEPACQVELSVASSDSAELAVEEPAHPLALTDLDRAVQALRLARRTFGLDAHRHRLRLLERLPPHAGFGSGTQLALAVGRALATLHGLSTPTPALAHALGRGARSGIGIAAFDEGGLVLDAGPGPHGQPAPVIARAELPSAWRVVLVERPGAQGLAGAAERAAIARLQPLGREAAAGLCHEVLMRLLPACHEDDFPAFALGLNELQRVIGAHFAPAQQGSAWTDDAVRTVAQALSGEDPAHPRAAIGQSSWGPTGFAIMPSQVAVEEALAGVAIPDGLRVRIVRARRAGAVVGRPA